jgi:hypothetical protein
MRTSFFRFLVGLALISGGARAQLAGAAGSVFRVQNFDIAELCTIHSYPSQTIAGSGVTVSGDRGASCASDVFAYQFARASAATFSVEFIPEYRAGGNGYPEGNILGSTSRVMSAHTLGIRLMAPLQSRISAYGSLGGGVGGFEYPTVLPTAPPVLSQTLTYHGVVEFGGGLDIRLWRRFSLRGEVRDFVTGQGLSGVPGRNHVLEAIGVGFHF